MPEMVAQLKPEPQENGAPAEPDLPIASFTPETLYSLLVAELAGQRERYDIFLSSYLHQAEKTRDPGIAKRATQIAIYLKAPEIALETAQIWAESAPWDNDAQQIYTFQLIANNQFDQAFSRMEAELLAGGDPHFEQLALDADNLTPAQLTGILARIDRLQEQHPDNAELLLTKTLLLETDNRLEEALQTAERLYRINPNNSTLLIKAKLLQQLKDYNASEILVDQALTDNPNSVQFRLVKAELMVARQQFLQAQAEYEKMTILAPNNNRIRLSYAALALHNNDLETAKTQLNLLIDDPQYQNDAYYQLGRLAEMEGDQDAAISYFQQVQQGDLSEAAYSRLGNILINQKRLEKLHEVFDQAREQIPDQKRRFYLIESDLLNQHQYHQAAHLLLSVALTDYPDDTALLYARALTSERMADLEAMEQDLRAILNRQPDNAMVLNALGYTLVDNTNRYQEALALIVKANDLQPDDPAITDSLGWALFKLGQFDEAVVLLRKAYELYPDPEIAAHLGEALYAIGENEQAQTLFHDALTANPESDILQRALDRLNLELAP